MNYKFAIICLLFLVFLSGCKKLHTHQIQIIPESIKYTSSYTALIPAEDVDEVKRILELAANKFNLVDKTDISRVPDTIKYYIESDPKFPFAIGVRSINDRILIDFNHFHPSDGVIPAYWKTKTFIQRELQKSFGDNAHWADQDNFIPADY